MQPGSVLAGRYQIGETLGRGGMGIVVKATHLQLGTPVAIKLLRREAIEEPDLVTRFLREARSAARLRGEHVCRVTDFGTGDDGTPFMVMEYLEGEDLQTIVDANGPLDPKLVAHYILQACIGIAEAHALGIVHRDLKPGNLFVVRQPDGRRSIKLLDFGIAKSRDASIDGSLTNTSKAMGSPAYMSPEQLKASPNVDARSDIWALGVTMFELLTEKRPFDGDTPYELAIQISIEPPTPLPETVPPELARTVMRCLEKEQAARFANVGELADALAPLVKNGRELATQVKAALAPHRADTEGARALAPESPLTMTTLGNASGAVSAIPAAKQRRWVLPAAMVGVAVAATLAAVMVLKKPAADAPAASPAAIDAPPIVDAMPIAEPATVEAPTVPDAMAMAGDPEPATDPTAATESQADAGATPAGTNGVTSTTTTPPAAEGVTTTTPTRRRAEKPARPTKPKKPKRKPIKDFGSSRY